MLPRTACVWSICSWHTSLARAMRSSALSVSRTCLSICFQLIEQDIDYAMDQRCCWHMLFNELLAGAASAGSTTPKVLSTPRIWLYRPVRILTN
ncbi:hypothetical protein PHO31112_05292 [Pandoraea horticolens]|uniref:Uncharacterized protein n=1 Tax=Pandoraea horticolens TaxID=2508298 RepID=A0A5E4ZAJ9_9BURK|nr:hypothetical protein PHO31112_05292 [Pandoraea horticolens]